MPLFSSLPFVTSTIIILTLALFTRIIHILPGFSPRSPKANTTRPSHILIVLGSGGHTAEMLSLVRDLDPHRYARRTYVVSSGDEFSAGKATEFEIILGEKHGLRGRGRRRVGADEEDDVSGMKAVEKQVTGDGDESEEVVLGRRMEGDAKNGGTFEIVTVPRARKIHQPLYTAPISSLVCIWSCISALRNSEYSTPDIILTNGPATGVIVVIAALILKFFGLEGRGEMKIVYVESWARVKTLSLSGRILQYGLVDRFLVQWEGLMARNREYRGVLVE